MKTELELCFLTGKKHGARYVAVLVDIDGSKEVIINPMENVEEKLAYYREKYNEDLVMNHVPFIKIVGFAYGNSFHQIEGELMY